MKVTYKSCTNEVEIDRFGRHIIAAPYAFDSEDKAMPSAC